MTHPRAGTWNRIGRTDASPGSDSRSAARRGGHASPAWHWVDPRFATTHKAAQVLRPGGYLAIWGAGHVMPEDGVRFFCEIQEVYDEIGEGLPAQIA